MNLIPLLVLEYLFPASKLVLEGGSSQQDSSNARGNYWAKCTGKESRVAAYQLLVHLVTNSEKNMVALVELLVSLHHSLNPDFLKEFQVWVNAYTGNTILIFCLHTSFSFCSNFDKPNKSVLVFIYLRVLYHVCAMMLTVCSGCGGTLYQWLCWPQEWGCYMLHEFSSATAIPGAWGG